MATAATKSPVKRFRVALEKYEGTEATAFTVPFDVQKVFGTRARVPVRGTINGHPFRGTIFPRAGGRHYMVVRKDLREAAGVRGGETVSVAMERDTETRVVNPPEDFAAALRADEAARAAWDKLSYTHRREYVEHIESAKKPETRRRRITASLSMLSAGRKEPHGR